MMEKYFDQKVGKQAPATNNDEDDL